MWVLLWLAWFAWVGPHLTEAQIVLGILVGFCTLNANYFAAREKGKNDS